MCVCVFAGPWKKMLGHAGTGAFCVRAPQTSQDNGANNLHEFR